MIRYHEPRWQVSEPGAEQWLADSNRLIALRTRTKLGSDACEAHEITASAFVPPTHARHSLPPLRLDLVEPNFDLGSGIIAAGTAYVNAGRKLMAHAPDDGEWRCIAASDGVLSRVPIVSSGDIFCAWHNTDETFVLSCTHEGRTHWSKPLAGGYIRTLAVKSSDVYAVANLPSPEQQTRSILYIANREDITHQNSIEIDCLTDDLVITDDVILWAGSMEYWVSPPGPIERMKKGTSINELRPIGGITSYGITSDNELYKRASGKRTVSTLHVLSISSMEVIAGSRIAGHAGTVVPLPTGGILIISEHFFETFIEFFSNWSSQPELIRRIKVTIENKPVFKERYVCGLIRTNSFEMLHSSLPAPRFAVWIFDVFNHTLDLHSTEFPEKCKGLFVGAEEITVFGADGVVIFAPFASMNDIPSGRVATDSEIPVGGPRIDLWGYDLDDAFLRGLLEHLIDDDPDGYSSLDHETRMMVISNLRDWWVREILSCLPEPGVSSQNVPLDLQQRLVHSGHFLLFEQIRLSKHLEPIPESIWNSSVSPYFLDVLSWCGRTALSSSSIQETASQVSERWAAGAPDMLNEGLAYERLTRELYDADLLGASARDDLQRALWRLWGGQANPFKRDVFISYSALDETAVPSAWLVKWPDPPGNQDEAEFLNTLVQRVRRAQEELFCYDESGQRKPMSAEPMRRGSGAAQRFSWVGESAVGFVVLFLLILFLIFMFLRSCY